MASSHTTTDGGTWWSYERRGAVGIWRIDDWEQLFESELADAEQHYRRTAGQSDITSTLVVFDEARTLDSEMQDHMTTAWSALSQAVDVEKTGYVADGITAMAVKANVEAPDTELESFESLVEALEWATD